MLLGRFGYCIILLTVFTCLLPTISAYHHNRRRKQYRRSSNYTHPGLRVVVNRTRINVTTTVDEGPGPRLKSVNPLLYVKSTNDGGSKKSIYHSNAYQYQPPPSEKVKEIQELHDQRKLLDTGTFKTLLQDLMTRLDTFPSQQQEIPVAPAPGAANSFGYSVHSEEGPRHINSYNARHCVLHGLWLSTVAGAAIELVPEQQDGHIEIHTKIFELPDNPFPPLINSQWTGKGIISQESPTTLTIVFQEHIGTEKENHAKETGRGKNENDGIDIQLPRTAVFVGQCLVCQGNPTLQGAWVVFPASQTCSIGSGFSWNNKNNGIQTQSQQTGDTFRMATPDAIYLLKYF